MTPAFKIPFPFLFSFFSFCVHQEDSRDQKVTHFNFVWPHFKKKKKFFFIKNKTKNKLEFSMASEQEITAYSPTPTRWRVGLLKREHLRLSASVAKHGIHNAGTIKRIYI